VSHTGNPQAGAARCAGTSTRLRLLHDEPGRALCLFHFAELLQKSQEAGEAGDVDVSMTLAQQAQELQGQHDRLYKTLTAPERTMTVCDICGVFSNSTDNDQRRQVRGKHAAATRADVAASLRAAPARASPNVTAKASIGVCCAARKADSCTGTPPVSSRRPGLVTLQEHLTGKQYLGWKAIREKFAELTNKWSGREPVAEARERSAPAEDRARSSDRDRARSSDRDRERERERERERSPSR
jgi:hypothetical protein